MEPRKPISIPVKIAVAAAVILLVNASILLIVGDGKWLGLETLITAADLTPLSALFWPLFETGGYVMLFGIDYARQAIWQRRQKEIAAARDEGMEQGIEQGRQERMEEGYRIGYDAGVADERNRRNGANGHNWMFGGLEDHA